MSGMTMKVSVAMCCLAFEGGLVLGIVDSPNFAGQHDTAEGLHVLRVPFRFLRYCRRSLLSLPPGQALKPTPNCCRRCEAETSPEREALNGIDPLPSTQIDLKPCMTPIQRQ